MRFLLMLLVASAAGAQPRAVLAKAEPHHHPVFEDATLRVLRVRVPAHDTTLLHQHDPDYFWIALGASTIVNAKPGVPDATITSQDLSIHYTPGKFAHVARNLAATPFDNITIEVLKPQSALQPLCDAVSADPLNCPAPGTAAKTPLAGASEHASFQTKQLRVSLVTIEPGKTIKPDGSTRGTWIIALDTLDTKSAKSLTVDAGGQWVGGTLHPSTAAWSLTNRTSHPVRALAVVERTPY